MQIIDNRHYQTRETRSVIVEIGKKQLTYTVIITTIDTGLNYIEYHRWGRGPGRITTSEKKQVKKLINETFNP